MAFLEGSFLDLEVRKWKVKPDASNLFGGVFQIALEWDKCRGETHLTEFVLFTKSGLRQLNSPHTAGHLLRAALRQSEGPLVCWCKNIDPLATRVAAYLCCKYRFSPEILSGQGPYKPIICIRILVTLTDPDPPCTVANLGGHDKWIIPEREDKLDLTGALRSCRIYGSNEERAAGIEEVEGRLVLVRVIGNDDDDDDDGSEDEMDCPICLKRFEKYGGAVQTPCSHIFHESCITKWLRRNDSCPMCRSACPVWV